MIDYKQWPQYLAVLSVTISTFCTGIHYGWPNSALPKLLSEDYVHNVTKEEASYVATIGSVGDIIGNILWSVLVDLIGRKKSILLVALPQILSMFMLLLSPYSVILLFVGRFAGGIAAGACVGIIPLYICEISEPKIRGILVTFFSITWSCGSLLINILGSHLPIKTTSLITLVFPFLFLASFSFMPESPYFFLMKNKLEKSRVCLKQLRRSQHVEKELAELTKDVKRQMSEKGRYRDLFIIPSNRTALLIMNCVSVFVEFSGISALTFYGQLFFTQATDVISEKLASMLMIILSLIMTLLSSLLMDKIGRRPLLIYSTIGCCLSLSCLTIFFFLRDYSFFSPNDLNWIPLACMLLFQTTFSLGLCSVVVSLYGELFSASIKAKAICVTNIIYAICVFCSTKIYQFLSDNYGLKYSTLLYAILQCTAVIFYWRYLPETRGKTLEEIQQEFKGGYRNRENVDNGLPLYNFKNEISN